GVAAITVPDNRWARCDIKSIALLPNVLANQAAHADDAFEALYVRDGIVLEGSHSNLFAVYDGELV
ncbi:MAG: D-amino acid aminotransferase, partial [Gemmatimonadetes bacterium]|nr:D-amino acid aminotransferase [Gemmatimonadota bacterium]NIQ54296.1 D-amino acid aminotransferase [Gemmatimonadota bacterium]NIU74506.1 D-amino acid aminotransferase [Gammaproteobacteria bacterium]NIX44459.1 D-amino acid aminotransferase [Gemmatimonadota bacterium]